MPTAKQILSDDELLERRDKHSFDAGFNAGIDWQRDVRDELLDCINDFLTGYCDEPSNEFKARRSDMAYRFRMAKNKAEGK